MRYAVSLITLFKDLVFLEIKNFNYTGMFKGNTCISINVLLEPIATVTSSAKILYVTGCVNFYPKMAWIGYILDLTLEAPVVLHYLKAPMAVKLTAVWFIAF